MPPPAGPAAVPSHWRNPARAMAMPQCGEVRLSHGSVSILASRTHGASGPGRVLHRRTALQFAALHCNSRHSLYCTATVAIKVVVFKLILNSKTSKFELNVNGWALCLKFCHYLATMTLGPLKFCNHFLH